MKTIQIGAAKADITPQLGCNLYGYVEVRYADRVLDPLSVNVLAIKQADETVLIFSTDICGLMIDKCTEIKKEIEKETGVKSENIFYSSIHTHSGPATRNSAGWGNENTDYLDNILLKQSIKAAKEALASMKDAVMGVGVTDSFAGINRREVENDKIVLGQNPDGPYDSKMTVLTFKTTDGKNIGTLVHFAMHPTVAGSGSTSISRDWPGYMVDRIEDITGAPCLYVNGAEGNVGPKISNGRTTGGEQYLPEIGNIAAADAERAYKSINEFEVPELKLIKTELELSYGPIPTLSEVEKQIEDMGNPDELKLTDITKHAQLQKIKKSLESGKKFPSGKKIQHTIMSIGDVAIVPYPFEVFTEVSLALREQSPYKNTLLFGLTGGSMAYLPVKEQIPYGGYEIGSFRASSIPAFDENLAEILLDKNVKLVKELYEKEK